MGTEQDYQESQGWKNLAPMEYPLNGVPFPLESGMNTESQIEKYYQGKMPARAWERIELEKHYPDLYKKFEKQENEKPNLARIILSWIQGNSQ